MKCELCHKADAKVAIARSNADGEDDELYVCQACAKAERQRHQKKSQRTRKISCDGMEMSITEISSGNGGDGHDEMPPFLDAIMGAFKNMADELEKSSVKHESKHKEAKENQKTEEILDLPLGRVDRDFRMLDGLHLEGLNLIGELDAVKRALRALKMELVGMSSGGLRDAGHSYQVRYSGSLERAKRVVRDILREERNARIRLIEEMPRVFGDAICRSLALIKNCRLLSSIDLFDLLSPIRLAARENLLDGITFCEVDRMIDGLSFDEHACPMDPDEQDRIDAERADAMNRRFEDVVLNDKAERKFI